MTSFIIFLGVLATLLLSPAVRRLFTKRDRALLQSADKLFSAELQRRGMGYSVNEEGLYEIDVRGQKVAANLENVRRDYEHDGDAGRVVRFVDQINGVTLEDEPVWEAVRPRIRYSLEPANYENRFEGVLCKFLTDELIQVFVYTSHDGSRVSWINESMLRDWGVTREQLIEQAEHNIAAIVDDAKLEVKDIEGSPLGMISTKEMAFKAALVLSPKFRDLVSPTHGWPVCVVVPCRDFVYVIRDGDQNLLGRLGSVVVDEYSKSGYPITTNLLRVSGDGVETIGTYRDTKK